MDRERLSNESYRTGLLRKTKRYSIRLHKLNCAASLTGNYKQLIK